MKLLKNIISFFIPFFFSTALVWGLATNYMTFSSGNVLTAAQLNGLQTWYTNAINAVLNGDTFTGNLLIQSGADTIYYTDAGTTVSAAVYGDSGKIIGAPLTYGQVNNCGLAISGSTLSVTDASGVALAANNPCYVVGENTTGGTLKVNKFATPQTVTFGAASDTDGNLFGITDANWANVMPMFVGVITNGTNSYFTLSRVPVVVSGAATTDLCQKGDTDCDAQGDVFVLTTGLTLSSWTSKPIVQVGWFNATYATTGGAWTFTLGAKTGFNTNYESVQFTFPLAQMGASAGTYQSSANFNTCSATMFYSLNSDGMLRIRGSAVWAGAGAADGVLIVSPYTMLTGGDLLGGIINNVSDGTTYFTAQNNTGSYYVRQEDSTAITSAGASGKTWGFNMTGKVF